MTAQEIRGSATYRAEVRGRLGVVAAGRHFAAEAGCGCSPAAATPRTPGLPPSSRRPSRRSHTSASAAKCLIILYLADRKEVVVISGQGSAPAAASIDVFREPGIPSNGPSAGTIPAVVDALSIALAGVRHAVPRRCPGSGDLARRRLPWYDFLTFYLAPELEDVRRYPSGARVYLQGPEGRIPAVGSLFRQAELAATLRALVEEEQRNLWRGREAAIYAARDRFYSGDVGQRIARAVQDAGGLITAADLASYRGRVEQPTRLEFTAHGYCYEVFKTGFWGQGPMLLQTLALLQGFDLAGLGHNSAEYIHTLTEALKLALADRDAYYGDPDFAKVPAEGLLAPAYAAGRRKLIDPKTASDLVRPGHPWRFEPGAEAQGAGPDAAMSSGATPSQVPPARAPIGSPDTTCVNVADARGNLFSASPSGAGSSAGSSSPETPGSPRQSNASVRPRRRPPQRGPRGKRPRTTLSPTLVLRDGKPFLSLSSPGGDSQDQQALQVLLNMIIFGMPAQTAIEAPRFNSLHYHESFGTHAIQPGMLEVENRFPADVIAELEVRGHKVVPVGAFMMDSGTTSPDSTPPTAPCFGAADVRRQRFVTGW